MVEKTKESGFTFLEMILVLAVLSIMTAIILPIGDKWIQTASEEDALQALLQRFIIYKLIRWRINVATRLEFKDSGTEYITSYYRLGGKLNLHRNVFPQGMRLASSSHLKAVEFHANGDIVKSGTLAFLTSSGLSKYGFNFSVEG